MGKATKLRQWATRRRNQNPLIQRAHEVAEGDYTASPVIKLVKDALENTRSPDVELMIRHRLGRLESLDASVGSQGEEMQRCAQDVIYWLTNYVWTFDPREDQPFLPFVPWLKQVEYLRWLEQLESNQSGGVVEKSRDQGATWLSAMFLLHRWLFKPGFKGAIGSRKEDLLDEQGNPDSIFEKLRMAIRMLPQWMLPRSLNLRLHLAYLKIINPNNGSSITGEAGDNIGRGGRASIYILDEAAFIMRSQLVERAMSHTTKVAVWVSTPNGMGNTFYRRRFSKQYPVFTLHWKDDPRKNAWMIVHESWVASLDEFQHLVIPDDVIIDYGIGKPPHKRPLGSKLIYPWYEREKKVYEHDPITLAQEVDIDYTASQEGITIPNKWVRAAIELDIPASAHRMGSLDIADEGGNRNVFILRGGAKVLGVFHWTKGTTVQTGWKAIGLCETNNAKDMVYDAGGGYGSGIKSIQNTERARRIRIRGINVGVPPTNDVWDSEGRSSKERFKNLKAELWWKLRRRFEKTYEYVELGIQHPLDELISIPNHPQLIQELSSVQHFHDESGKIKIETKKQLKTRGIESPDFADALVMSEYRIPSFTPVAGGASVSSPIVAGGINIGASDGIPREMRL